MRLTLAFFALTLVLAAQADLRATPQEPTFDPDAVERGRQLLVSQCGFCHGPMARGGSGGPDLTRSELVQTDENGRQLSAFLAVGRPDRGMPKFDLNPEQMSDLATFLHSTIYVAVKRNLYKILDIVVGDPKAGETYFNGTGRCGTCHSPTGDLKAVGTKYDPSTLQGRLLLPRGRPAASGSPPSPLYLDPTAIRATVTSPSGESVTGGLVRLTDFELTLYDAKAQRIRSWLRNGDLPRIVITDPLQAHVDRLIKWTDADMHNMTAYLVGLK
jgi:mono/diheme cytochrome c family protein